MSKKLKTLGLTIVAALAVAAVGAISASATGVGHFTADSNHVLLHGDQESGSNRLVFVDPDLGSVHCPTATLEGTIADDDATVTSVNIAPEYPTDCSATTAVGTFTTHVAMNGCEFEFTINTKAGGDNKAHLLCPSGQQVHLTTTGGILGNCTVTIKPQSPSGGVAYTAITGPKSGKAAITADATVSGIHAERHGGISCAFASTTTNSAQLNGSGIVEGFDTDENGVGIYATGSED